MAVCKKCDKDIYEMESNLYGEKCRSCYSEDNYIRNKTAIVIKVIAILGIIVGVIYGIVLAQSAYTEDLAVPVIVGSILSSVFIYGFGEIIQKLQNIEDNTIKK